MRSLDAILGIQTHNTCLLGVFSTVCVNSWVFLSYVLLFFFLLIMSLKELSTVEELSDLWSRVSNHTVLLVAVLFHKCPFPPYQRGFFCSDDGIGLTHKGSTVSTTALTATGVTLPVVSVSPAVVLQENEGTRVGTRSVHPVACLWRLRRRDWSERLWLSLGGLCWTSLAATHVYFAILSPIFQSF